VTGEPIVADELVDRFLRAVSDLGKANQRGWAAGEDVMQRMDWDPSDLYLANPFAREDADRYKDLAWHCVDEGYITKEADLYARVTITPKGEGRIFDG
jgi:hypothetical protein